MNKEEFKKGKYLLHSIIGLLLGYDIHQFMLNHMNLSDWKEFIPHSGIDFSWIATAFAVFGIALFWEIVIQGMIMKAKSSMPDAYATTIGGFFGALLCMVLPDNNWLFYGFMIVGLAIVYREVRTYKLK